MQQKDQIAELFKESFENYEAPVRSGLWEKVASRIETTVPPTDPGSSVATQAVTGASKITGSLMSWIGGAVLVASIGTGIYLYQRTEITSDSKTNSPETVVNPGNVQPAVSTPSDKSNESANTSESSIKNTNSASEKHQVVANSNSGNAVDQGSVNKDANQGTSDLTTNNSNSTKSTISFTSYDIPETVDNKSADVSADADNNATTPAVNTVEANPFKAVINAEPASGKAPLTVMFSTPTKANSTEWLFGDGSETVKGNNINHEFTQPGSYLVTLKTVDENGTSHVEIKRIEVLSDLTITNIPNVFTPNGDGLNDEFFVKAAEGVEIEVSIFDTGGKLVHRFTGVENSWNGKINNVREAEAGTYFYVIFATGPNGEKNTQKGTLSLKR